MFLPAVIIAGNDSSIGQINYKRLPKTFDPFRVNNFYFEKNVILTL
ncbi:alpha-2,3-sialyltransferase [Brevinema andersonii]